MTYAMLAGFALICWQVQRTRPLGMTAADAARIKADPPRRKPACRCYECRMGSGA